MAWTHNIDSTDPLATALVSGGAAEFRQLKADILERLNSVYVDFNAQPLVPKSASAGAGNDIFWIAGAGPPVSGGAGTGANVTGPCSIYSDYTNKVNYQNVGTKAAPSWAPFTLGDSV